MSYYPQLPRESFQHLRESWIAYVNVERKKDGMGWDLPKGRRCDCGKSRTTPTGLPQAKPRQLTNSNVSWGNHTPIGNT